MIHYHIILYLHSHYFFRTQKQHNDVAVKSIAKADCDEMKGINNDFIAEPSPETNVYEDELVVQENDENIYSNKMGMLFNKS